MSALNFIFFLMFGGAAFVGIGVYWIDRSQFVWWLPVMGVVFAYISLQSFIAMFKNHDYERKKEAGRKARRRSNARPENVVPLSVGQAYNLTNLQYGNSIRDQHRWNSENKHGELNLPQYGFADYEEYITAVEVAENEDRAARNNIDVKFTPAEAQELWKKQGEGDPYRKYFE